MKTSHKTLLITLMIILAFTTIMIVGMEIFFSYNAFPRQKIAGNSKKILTQEFELQDFESIRCGGAWQLEIVQSDSYQVIIDAPEFMMDYVKPEVLGKTLQINQWFFAEPQGVSLKARIFMPSLTGIEASGFSSCYFSGFKSAGLRLKASETSRILGGNSKIENLDCTGAGSAQISLGSCETVNADFDISSASEITLNMAGGKLNGRAADTAILTYSGELAEAAINTSGTVKIQKRPVPETSKVKE